MPKHLPFDLHLAADPPGYLSRVLRSPAGQASAPFWLPFTNAQLDLLVQDIAGAPPAGLPPDQFGRLLYEALFAGPTGDSLADSRKSQPGLRLNLRLTETPELANLPWEYLYDPEQRRFLALSEQTPIVRYLDLPVGEAALAIQPPLRILAVLASPPDHPPVLDLAREWDALETGLASAQKSGLLVLERLENPTFARLQERLAAGPVHILHFAGHASFDSAADSGHLVFADGAGNAALVPADDLAALLHSHPGLRLALFNACEGAISSDVNPFTGVAQAVAAQGIPGVIAMQQVISDSAGALFAEGFYSGLAEGLAVDMALTRGRLQVYTADDVEWAAPVLYLRADDAQLFAPLPLRRQVFRRLLDDRRALFAGRDGLLAELTAFAADPTGRYLFLTAPAGFGKTALLANWVDPESVRVAYHFFDPVFTPDSLDEMTFLQNVLEQMAGWYGHDAPLPHTLGELRALYQRFQAMPLTDNRALVLDGLDEVTGWSLAPYLGRLAEGVHLILSARKTGVDWVSHFAMPADQVQLRELDALSPDEVRAILGRAGGEAARLAADSAFVERLMRLAGLDGDPERGADPFVVSFIAQDAADGDFDPNLPAGMDAYLERWWQAIRQKFGPKGNRNQAVVDLLGSLTVALGPLSQADLEALNDSLVDDLEVNYFREVLAAVRRHVAGDPEGGYVLAHPKLREYIQGQLRTDAYAARLLDYCAGWESNGSLYALAHYAQHLHREIERLGQAAAGAPPARRESLVAEQEEQRAALADLLRNDAFRWRHQEEVGSPGALYRDFDLALYAAAASPAPSMLPRLLGLAFARVQFERDELNPRRLFDRLGSGDWREIVRPLSLFDVDRDWQQAITLFLAWLSADNDSTSAQALRRRVQVDASAGGPLARLAVWVDSALHLGPPPEDDLFPVYVDEVEARALVAKLGGHVGEPVMTDVGAGSGAELIGRGNYFAETDGPVLVDFVRRHPTPGEELFDHYLAIHTGYYYTEYRNRSLWYLLDAVLRNVQDPGWVQEQSRKIIEATLTAASPEFVEGTAISLRGWRAFFGEGSAGADFDAASQKALADSFALIPTRGLSDAFGQFKRRLAAYAQTHARLLDQDPRAEALLDRAVDRDLPYGFAGFQTSACLAVAEAVRICQPGNWSDIQAALEASRTAAHNIQDATFCAISTARCNALNRAWWKKEGIDVEAVIPRLVADPEGAEFAALHRVGEKYSHREYSERLDLPETMRQARTLAEIAEVYKQPLSRLLELNPKLKPNRKLQMGSRVAIPDPGMALLLVGRLSAEVLIREELGPERQLGLLRQLVPLAVKKPTVLDTLLSRLLLLAPVAEADLLGELEDVSRWSVAWEPVDPAAQMLTSFVP